MRATAQTLLVVVTLSVVAACSGSSAPAPSTGASRSASPSATSATASPTTTAPTSTAPPPSPSTAAITFRDRAAMATVRRLAIDIGPREATSPAYGRAARWVEAEFSKLGYDVQRQRLHVPAGSSWGVPVGAGETWNVVARPRGLRTGQPYVVVGAQLDTVPQAPGAEDNASGVAVLLETARLAAALPTRWPVVFVAFAAEEPRNATGSAHHFGSRAMVARLSEVERSTLRAMVSVDRVGVGRSVPICNGRVTPSSTTKSLRRAARAVGVAHRSCGANRSSDQWSFETAGFPAARIGSTPYAEYHSARDLPSVVDPAQLGRVGRVLWEWLSGQ